MAVRTDIKNFLNASQTGSGDYSGHVRADFEIAEVWESGTGANQAARLYYDERTLAASTGEDLDLTTITDAYGVALGLTEVRALCIQAAAANGAAIEVKPSSSNGWTALLKDASDILQIPAGCSAQFILGPDGSAPVSGSSKSLNISNTSGSDSGTYTLLILGASA